ncbi:MAG: DUF302 domain-containing protein [Anaerolineae bacterium]|nr:DUF302 domain-containing protein [Anaerolineae bacterium]
MSDILAFEVVLPVGMEEAIERLTAVLKVEGFGVLSRIDAHKIFKEKLGEDFRPFVMLGVCNPHLAFQSLNINPSVGLFLPCPVTVEEVSDGILISIGDPEVVLNHKVFQDSDIGCEVAPEARIRLMRVVDSLRA